MSVTAEGSSIDLWHQHLGHLNKHQLSQLITGKAVNGVNLTKTVNISLNFYEGCIEGKMQRKSFMPVGEIRSTRKVQCVNSDVCGPMPVEPLWRQEVLCYSH